MRKQPLVSIVLNVYNGEAYLAACIQSVQNQTYSNWELIISDDGSTDGTPDLIRRFTQADDRIRCITRTQRRHIPCTINDALALVQGDWIAHIDADDLWLPEKLERQLAYLDTHPECGACFTGCDLIDAKDQINNDQFPGIYRLLNTHHETRKDWLRHFFYHGNCLVHSSSLVRRDLMKKHDVLCRQIHDFILWCQLIPETEFAYLTEPLVRMRWEITPEKGSAPTPENDRRLDNETLLVARPLLINGLSDCQFKEFFGEDFRCKSSASPLELAWERAFLLFPDPLTHTEMSYPGFAALHTLLNTPGAVEVLEQTFGLSTVELYRLTGTPVFYSRLDQQHAAQLEQQCAAGEAEAAVLNEQLNQTTEQLSAAQQTIETLNHELDIYHNEYTCAIQQRNDMLANNAALLSSMSWRITKPMRLVTGGLRRFVRKSPHLLLICKALRMFLTRGPRFTWKRIKDHRRRVRHLKACARWEKQWVQENGSLVPPPLFGCTFEVYEAQRKATFPKDIKFSILVPLYNTPEQFLREMIASVQHQTYANWELCLADGSDEQHPEVGALVRKLAEEDPRIRYQKLEENLGISGNTNACIDMATGDYIGLFDHDDLLHPSVLYENMVAICEQDADFLYTDENTFHDTPKDAFCPHLKPDFAPDNLRANNYICHFTVFSRELQQKVGYFRPECDGSQDFDMVLRLTEQAKHIVHIPKILYYWRAHKGSVASDISAKPYVIEAAHKAVADHLARVGLKGQVLDSVVPSMYRLKYDIPDPKLVSIIICTKDHREDLQLCVESILNKTTYPNYEIVIVENNSTEPETFEYYKELERNPRIRVVTWTSPTKEFNYSAINNYGVEQSKGEFVLLLNNDTEVITPGWLEEMVMYAQRSDVGAVGAKLYYPDNTIQHAGLGIGLLTLAGHYHRNFPRTHPGYMGRLIYAQDVSGVTAACILMRRTVWDEVHGLDETFKVAFNDVDLCMRIRKAGYLIIFTPFAELYHYESKSRGLDKDPEKRARFVGEVTRFQTRWKQELADGDPYYNPNFSLDTEDFSVRSDI